MVNTRARWTLAAISCLLLVRLDAATTSPQQAETFSRKIEQIQRQGASPKSSTPVRTALSQDELNSWFAYRAQQRMPAGVSRMQLTMIGQGRVSGQATVDLEAIGKQRATGGAFDPWSFVGGRVPVTVTGILRSQNGQARFELEEADISGVPVPATLFQELLTHYSRTESTPQGIRLDDPFQLPANIRHIEVGAGRAVVVQ
jgi:hypothetical protein